MSTLRERLVAAYRFAGVPDPERVVDVFLNRRDGDLIIAAEAAAGETPPEERPDWPVDPAWRRPGA